jgi:hypothetical protein
MRRDDDLPVGLVRPDAHHQPVHRREQRILYEVVVPARHASGNRHVHEDEVREEKAEAPHQVDPRREERGDGRRVRDQPDDGHRPVDRVDQKAQQRSADGHLKGEPVCQAQFAEKLKRLAGMHQPRLQVALHPARALAKPRPERAVGFLPGGGGEHRGAPAVLVQTDAEVAVLSDVEGVPAAEVLERRHAEVIARPTQRDRRPGGRQSGQEEVEPHGVLRGEPAREQILPLIVIIEFRLNAHHAIGNLAERDGGFLELIGLRPILRIVDDQQVRVAGEKAVVTRLRLGLGLTVGDHHRPDVRGQVHRLRCGDGLLVVLLQQQHHVELLRRVVHPLQTLDEPPEHRGLAVERNQQGVRGEHGLIDRRDLLLCGVEQHRTLKGDSDEVELVHRVDHVKRDQQPIDRDQRRQRAHDEQNCQHRHQHKRPDGLRARDRLTGAFIGPLMQNPQDRNL